MRPFTRVLFGAVFVFPIFFIQGCGYTQKTTLPREMKTIYVDTVENHIPLEDMYAYFPGLEMLITNAVVRRLNEDGILLVTHQKDADVVLKSKLIGFEQGGVRFSSLESVEEFRLFIVLSLELIDTKTNEVIWAEPNFSGDAEYFVSDVRSTAREEGSRRAVERLAKNVVDRIVEDW